MKVQCDERVAIYIDPEPCAGIREDVGEASAGERTGQPLSRERVGAAVVQDTEGRILWRVIASPPMTWRGRTDLVPEFFGQFGIGLKPLSGVLR